MEKASLSKSGKLAVYGMYGMAAVEFLSDVLLSDEVDIGSFLFIGLPMILFAVLAQRGKRWSMVVGTVLGGLFGLFSVLGFSDGFDQLDSTDQTVAVIFMLLGLAVVIFGIGALRKKSS